MELEKMIKVKNAEEATQIAKRYFTEACELYYDITGAKREGEYWIVTAHTLGLDMMVKINSGTGGVDEYSSQSV
jgi:hypothetical protein